MKKPISDFLQSALKLEDIFAGIEQLAGSLDRLEPNSEAELERAKKLLVHFTEKSEGLQEALETLVRSLQDRRESVERAVATVHAKAPLIAEMFRQAEEKQERLQSLADRVKAFAEEARGLPADEVKARLEAMSLEAAALQEQARLGKLRSLEKNAQSLRATLKDIVRSL